MNRNLGIIIASVFLVLCVTVAVYPADRDSGWGNLRDECVTEQKVCQWCGTDKDLEGHHIIEFSYAPKYEMVKLNVIVLCRKCHYQIGHGGKSWESFNPFVKEECENHRTNMKHYTEKIKELTKKFDLYRSDNE